MSLIESCKTGIEGFPTVFEYWLKNGGSCCTAIEGAGIDFTSPAWVEYNNTLCDLAQACVKTEAVGSTFFSCLQNSFCAHATTAVKEMGKVVYEVHKQAFYDSAMQALPWYVGGIVIGFVRGELIDKYAPKTVASTTFSWAAKGVSVVSGFLAASALDQIYK